MEGVEVSFLLLELERDDAFDFAVGVTHIVFEDDEFEAYGIVETLFINDDTDVDVVACDESLVEV